MAVEGCGGCDALRLARAPVFTDDRLENGVLSGAGMAVTMVGTVEPLLMAVSGLEKVAPADVSEEALSCETGCKGGTRAALLDDSRRRC